MVQLTSMRAQCKRSSACPEHRFEAPITAEQSLRCGRGAMDIEAEVLLAMFALRSSLPGRIPGCKNTRDPRLPVQRPDWTCSRRLWCRSSMSGSRDPIERRATCLSECACLGRFRLCSQTSSYAATPHWTIWDAAESAGSRSLRTEFCPRQAGGARYPCLFCRGGVQSPLECCQCLV